MTPVNHQLLRPWHFSSSFISLKLLDKVVGGAGFFLLVFWSTALFIVDLWQCSACYLRLRVTQCLLWTERYLCLMWRRLLLVVLWFLLAVELISSVEPLCPSQCLSEAILVTLYLTVWDWRVLRAEPKLSCWLICPFFLSLLFSHFLPSMDWLCVVEVFGLIVFS